MRDLASNDNLVKSLRLTIPSGQVPVEVDVYGGPLFVYHGLETHNVGTTWVGPFLYLTRSPSTAFEPVISINGLVLSRGPDYTREGAKLDLSKYLASGYSPAEGDILSAYYFPAEGPGSFSSSAVSAKVSARYIVDSSADGVTLSLPYPVDPSRFSHVFLDGVRMVPGIDYRFESDTLVLWRAVGSPDTSVVYVVFSTHLENTGFSPVSGYTSVSSSLPLVSAMTADEVSLGSSASIVCGATALSVADIVALKALVTPT